MNNTPIVAMLIPAVSDLAREGGTSPSKLLIPLSYASMVGGMLTLVGTSTNLIASNVSARLLGNPFSMFEFTALGVVVFVTGVVYLLTVGRYLIPERIKPDDGLLAEFEMSEYLTEVVVEEGAPFIEPFTNKTIRAGDALVVRAELDALNELTSTEGLSVASTADARRISKRSKNARRTVRRSRVGRDFPACWSHPAGNRVRRDWCGALIGALVAGTATYLPVIGVLWVFYVITASSIGANPFAFVLAVTFAASADFVIPTISVSEHRCSYSSPW